MRTRIVALSELKKRPGEREAEQFLNQLSSDNAIEVTPTGRDTPRKVSHLYRKVAKNLGKEIRVMTKGEKVFVRLK
ncbi:MAG: hypothetical protein HY676_04775 [Chloroflexi bacterium]|nr:hypothetical protein [Chloroflexota bacterium]